MKLLIRGKKLLGKIDLLTEMRKGKKIITERRKLSNKKSLTFFGYRKDGLPNSFDFNVNPSSKSLIHVSSIGTIRQRNA